MEIRENSQKRVLLSVLGVAILVVAVIGISFAAYSGSGASNDNTINTGTLMVSYQEDSTAIEITDALPMSDEDGMDPENLTEDKESFTFTVSANASDAVTIPYTVTLTPANSGDGNFLTDSQVKVYLTKDGQAVFSAKAVSALTPATGNRDGSYVLATGSETFADDNTTAKTSTYVLKMWVDSQVDVSGDTSYSYSAKVNVDSAVAPIA